MQKNEQCVIDISVELEHSAVPVPKDPPFSRTLVQNHGEHGCEVSELRLSAHHGTHLDFPAHFFPNGKRQGDYPAEAFVLPALVVETTEATPGLVDAREIEASGLAESEALLLKTANSRLGLASGGRFQAPFSSMGADAAEWLISRKAPLVGIDACSIEAFGGDRYPVHTNLLSAGVLILEGLDLSAAPPGRYTLVCAPLGIAEAEGAPVRALLLSQRP